MPPLAPLPSFEPLENPIGFGAVDFLEAALALLLIAYAFLWRPFVQPRLARLAPRTAWSMLLLACLPLALRLLLLPQHPAPTPNVYDEFAHLLAADTLLHFRLANPPHPLSRFFETIYALQQPSYGSIYAIGTGLLLAAGRFLSGVPWTGVLLAMSALCALTYWMLRGWTTPGWALAGGFLAIFQFGPLNEWTNEYWGGHVQAAAGCLVFGALPRLRARRRALDGALLGLGLGFLLLTRPFESSFAFAGAFLFLLPEFRLPALRSLRRPAAACLIAAAPAVLLTLAQNRQATGSWTTLPYVLSRSQYGVPATFTFQPSPVPHSTLTPQQRGDYEMQLSFHGSGPETLDRYTGRLEYRVRFWRFFLLPPLYLALPFFLPSLADTRYLCLFGTLLVYVLGANFYPFFFPHYAGQFAGPILLAAVTGLDRLTRISWHGHAAGAEAASLLVFLCAAHFTLWYAAHLRDRDPASLALRQYETWYHVNHPGEERRRPIYDAVDHLPGSKLVFVRYSPRHGFQEEWVYNAADIDAARVVWARDLGPAANQSLRDRYPRRSVWLLEPDFNPPKLAPFPAEPPPPPPAAPAPPPATAPRPALRLEQVHAP